MAKLPEFAGDLEDALDRVKVPSYVYDRHGIIRWVNRAGLELVGDVRGRQITSVVAPEETRRAQEAYLTHIYSSEDAEGQVVLLDEKGNRMSVEVSSVCLYHGHHVIGVFGQLSDSQEEGEMPPHRQLTLPQDAVLRLLE